MTPSPVSLSKLNATESASTLKAIALSSPRQIREWYGAKPITLLKMLDPNIRFPAKLREIFACLWLEQDAKGKRARRFIIKGPRGGGKSNLLGAIGFVKWYLQLRKIVDMGGSLAQAQGVYNYFAGHCYSWPSIVEHMPAEPTLNKSVTDRGNYFRAVAASAKAVRGPHPDNLFIDEACEVKDELILAALPMVNTSRQSMVVMTSTFHKIFGLFQETWDKAEELGYARFSWDMFDVMMPFPADIWKDPEYLEAMSDFTIEQAGENSLEHRAGGRTGDPEGWVPMENVIQAWREKSTIDWFDVEYMGSRPNAVGMVNNPEDVDACVTKGELPKEFAWREGVEAVGCIDWGFSTMTAMLGLHQAKDGIIGQHFQKTYTAVRSHKIIEQAVDNVKKFGWKVIYCDSAGKFENADLKAALIKEFNGTKTRCIVVEVNFGTEKPQILGNYRAYFARRMLRIPGTDEYRPGVWQHKGYRYQEGSDKPEKKDDHVPDAMMCGLKHWPLGRAPQQLPESNLKKKQRAIPTKTITGGMMSEQF